MRGQNLGRGLTIVFRYWRGCDHEDEFGRAMGAPMGELRSIISRGRVRGFRTIKKMVKAETGLRWRVFVKEVERRTNPRWTYMMQLERNREYEFPY